MLCKSHSLSLTILSLRLVISRRFLTLELKRLALIDKNSFWKLTENAVPWNELTTTNDAFFIRLKNTSGVAQPKTNQYKKVLKLSRYN